MARHSAIAIWALVLLGWSSQSSALEPQRASSVPICVDYVAPPGCSQLSAFHAGVQARTERVRAASPGEACLKVRVEIVPGPSRVRGDLRVQDESGHSDSRSVEGAQCEEVALALALTLALAIDPEASPDKRVTSADNSQAISTTELAGGQSGSTSKALLPPARSPENPPALEEPPHADDRDRAGGKPWRAELGFEALITSVVTTGPSFGVGISLRARSGDGPSLGISLQHLRNDFLDTPDDAEVALTQAQLSACPLQLSAALFALEPCATMAGGYLRATGLHLDEPATSKRSWWAGGASVRGRLSLGGSSAVELEVGAAVPLLRRRYVAGSPERALAETQSISPAAGLRFVHRF